jgi:hypothetical protein
MEGLESIGRMLIIGGLTMAAVGGVLLLLARIPGLDELPGTIRIERPGFSCIFPLLASIILSVLLTIVLNVIARLLGK